MKKTLFLVVSSLLLLAVSAQAENFTFTSYYPAPTGNYKSIRLTPQTALPTSDCTLGTIYANTNDNNLPYFCSPNGVGTATFSPVAGAWTLSGNDLFLTDTANPLNKKVGIGTTAPRFKLTIENDGGILADGPVTTSSALPVSGAGTRLMWYPAKGAFRAGDVSATQWDDANIGISSVAMGQNNIAISQGATIWSGQNNSASGGASPFAPVIAGGANNTASSELAQILGGSGNTASGISTRIFGKNNVASGSYSLIGGGENNISRGQKTVLAGGYANVIGSDSNGITLSGGGENTVYGVNDVATDINHYTTISGGYKNMIERQSTYSTIAGGNQNNINRSLFSVISGGSVNTVGSIALGNTTYHTISGGFTNVISAGTTNATISGGDRNQSSCPHYCSIGGGSQNSTIGQSATIIGGNTNTARGINSFVPGGENNIAFGNYSLAAGRFMNLTGNNSFVWGYSNALIPAITATTAMIIYSGSMGIRDTSPAALLEINDNGSTTDTEYLNLASAQNIITAGDILTILKGGVTNGYIGVNHTSPTHPLQFGNGAYVATNGNFVDASSRIYKENITELNFEQARDTLTKLTAVQYNYKNGTGQHHLGFIAEDVPDLVVAQDRQGLVPMDIATVLTKVIAQQHNVLQKQKIETDSLLKEISELKNKIHARAKSR